MDVRKLSKPLYDACRTDEFYSIFNNEFGACDGGCLMVAVALKRHLKIGKYAALYRSKIYDHVMLQVGALYLDGDGVANGDQLTNRWSTRYDQYRIVPAYIQAARNLGLYSYSERQVKELVDYFSKVLPLGE